jgi:hypothetical protein
MNLDKKNTKEYKRMPNYQQGKIYCIRSHQTDEIYIGSTTQTLAERLTKHKNSIKCSYRTSQHILQYQDAYIELIELFPCNSKEELNKKEGEHIRLNNCVNKRIAGRTGQEWREENKEHRTSQQKEYYETNKDQIKETQKHYREDNKEQLKKYQEQYQEKNKEQLKLYKAQWYQKNKKIKPTQPQEVLAN